MPRREAHPAASTGGTTGSLPCRGSAAGKASSPGLGVHGSRGAAPARSRRGLARAECHIHLQWGPGHLTGSLHSSVLCALWGEQDGIACIAEGALEELSNPGAVGWAVEEVGAAVSRSSPNPELLGLRRPLV